METLVGESSSPFHWETTVTLSRSILQSLPFGPTKVLETAEVLFNHVFRKFDISEDKV